jgi:uncharacterized membrane protein
MFSGGRQMRQVNRDRASLSIFSVVLLIFLIVPSLVLAQEEKKDLRPEHGIAVFPEFSGVAVPKGETVRMDLILENKGRADEVIDVKISTIPKGWKATLKGGSYVVSGLYVPNGKTKNLALTLEPDKTVGPGTYTFQFDAQTADGKFTSSNKLNVMVQERTAGLEDIQITTSYPVLRGQTDAKFEFSLDIMNKSEVDRTFNLAAVGPEKWEINFKPAYETKQISSLRIKGGTSQSVAVEVTPAKEAQPGEYPILVRVTSGEKRAEVKLRVALTGIYKLDAGTPSGILSLEAIAGKPANFSFYVKNTGSAVNRNISFSSFKPENWEVTFKPEKIDSLEPGALKQVEVTVKPAVQALVGDYSVGVLVNGEKSDKTIEMRVTVKASTAWGWIGIGIIIFVIAGLSALFIWLGRR